MQFIVAPLGRCISASLVRPAGLTVKLRSCVTSRTTRFDMKRCITNECPSEEVKIKRTTRSKYFPISTPESSNSLNKSEIDTIKVEKKTIPSVRSISSPTSPIKKKQKRMKKINNPVDTAALSFLQQVDFISDIPKLTCGFERFGQGFYDVPCIDLARNLLGQVLVRRLEDGTLLKGRIVETECYLGGEDKASHSHNGRLTDRNLPMYMKPGTAYVYFTYGMYHCFNISSQGPGAAVLLRALDPLDGDHHMHARRTAPRKKTPPAVEPTSKKTKTFKPHELCNGPAKLCISFGIEKLTCNKQDLASWEGMWVEKSSDDFKVREHHIVKTHRIGIDSAGIEWATKPLRFYLMGNKSVSRRDKNKEKELKEIASFLA